MQAIEINIDFEIYSECDLKKAGAYAYAEHETTEVVCLAYSIDGAEPELWIPSMEPPKDLFEAIDKGYTVVAWNSFFEWCIWHLTLDWPVIPIEQWSDTAAHARASSLPGALGQCAEALGVPSDKAKDKRGKQLIQKLSKPYRGKRYDKEDKQDLLQEFYEYCKQDVVSEAFIRTKIRPISQAEKEIWDIDQAANIRGVRIDMDAVAHARYLRDLSNERDNALLDLITEGRVASVDKLPDIKAWMAEKGHPVKSLAAEAIDQLLASELPEDIHKVLEIRASGGKSSVAKYDSLAAIIGKDGRAHGLLLYHGAGTGRWAGRLFQPQNLPRPDFDDTDECIAILNSRDMAYIEMLYGDIMPALSSCLRGMICASEGKSLFVSDYSAIEARVTAWLAGQDDILAVFKTHGKIYEYTASQIYGVPWQEIGKKSEERFIGKTANLALGFQGGAGAFIGMAENFGVDIDAELAEKVKTDWRKANPNIVQCWWDTEKAAKEAIRRPGVLVEVGKVAYAYSNKYKALFCRLPSGRTISYYDAHLANAETPFGTKQQIHFWGINSYTRKWCRQSTYGGKLFQNYVQATARDLMANAFKNLTYAGFDVLLTVHDEIISEADPADHTLKEYDQIMEALPDWAEGLPVRSEGFIAQRYRKD